MEFKFPLQLAPMVGLSHAILRQVLLEYTPQEAQTFWPTEMLNSRKIPRENVGFTPETILHEHEVNLVPQILGNEEGYIRDSIQKLKNTWGENVMKGIDINMGCPVQKALKHNYGVALMGDVNYAAQVVKYAVNASSLPVSVKLRAVGSEEKSYDELLQFVLKLQEAGASWVTLHPRTAAQKRRGTADWSQITYLKKHLDVPVIGNGDIQTYHDVIRMLDETQCDAVMAGRALAARPWMMWQLGEYLALKEPLINQNKTRSAPQTAEEEGAEYGRMLLRFIDLIDLYYVQKLNLQFDYVKRKIIFFVKTTHVWLEFGHTLYSEMGRAQNLEDMRERVQMFFKNEQRMMGYTELRQ